MLAEKLTDTPDDLATFEGGELTLTRIDIAALRTVIPFVRQDVWDTAGVLLETFRQMVERPVVRQATPEAALSRFEGAFHDIIHTLVVGVDHLLLPSIFSTAHEEVEPFDLQPTQDAQATRLVPLARRRLGRFHAEVFKGALLRSNATQRLAIDLHLELSRTVEKPWLRTALTGPSTMVPVQRAGVRVAGLFLVCAMALEDDPELPVDASTRAVLRGLSESLWSAAYRNDEAVMLWAHFCLNMLRENKLAIAPEFDARIAAAASIEGRFESLVREWRWATGHLSDPAQALTHPAYAAITALGPAAVPLIVREMEQGSLDDWHVALRALTGAAPEIAPESRGDLDALRHAWLLFLKPPTPSE